MHPMDDKPSQMGKLVLLRHDEQRGEHRRGVLDGRVERERVHVLQEREYDGVRFCKGWRSG